MLEQIIGGSEFIMVNLMVMKEENLEDEYLFQKILKVLLLALLMTVMI